MTRADVAWVLRKSAYGSVGAVDDLQVVKRTPSGRAQQVAIVGRERTLTVSGYDLRQLFGFDHIRSPRFSIFDEGDAFVLDGRGWGHGVGMCQWGAAELARRGLLAQEILAFYYPGSEIARLSDVVPAAAAP